MPDCSFAYAAVARNNDLSFRLALKESLGRIRRSSAGRKFMWDIADGWVWALVVIGGPLLIGIFMAVFSSRRRRLSQTEQKISDQAAHENWGKERVR
jgi:hypothetical protein